MNQASPKETPRAFALLHFASFLAVSTLIATIAIPAWFSQGDVTLERAATLLARDLRAVKTMPSSPGRTSTSTSYLMVTATRH